MKITQRLKALTKRKYVRGLIILALTMLLFHLFGKRALQELIERSFDKQDIAEKQAAH